MSNEFLFSIDLEDVRSNVKDGHKFVDRVKENTFLFLNWMNERNVKCTFFVVGKIAESYPDLIKTIIDHGHEIACHSYSHQSIINLGIDNFKLDLTKNIDALEKAGASNIIGYRAPTFSLTQEVNWVYKILDEHGIKYSSSVLPAKSPLFGWESFGTEIKIVDNIIEMPISVDKFGPMTIPIAGGVYLRVLPKALLFRKIKNNLKIINQPLLSYIHPYDLDTKQEYFMHEHMTNVFYNFLMYYNRKNLLKRLDKILDLGYTIVPYKEYLKKNHDKF